MLGLDHTARGRGELVDERPRERVEFAEAAVMQRQASLLTDAHRAMVADGARADCAVRCGFASDPPGARAKWPDEFGF
ncbi:MAG TPA: hypothetical protein VK034_03980 [Enhygromyxa sp.]|nr:hypothetical protein [Enhygromyxa sp.]